METNSKGTLMTTIEISPYDAAEYLKSEDAIIEYLSAALDENDPALFLAALSDVARARGMTKVAKEAGIGRESLYKALAPNAKPRYDSVLKLMTSMGIRLSIKPTTAP